MSGEFCIGLLWAIFSTKILRGRVGGRGKNDFCGTMAAGSGAELGTGAAGRHPGERGRRRGELVRFNSKSYRVPVKDINVIRYSNGNVKRFK